MSRWRKAPSIVCLVMALGCANVPSELSREITPDVSVFIVGPGVWRHVTWRGEGERRFASNGLLVAHRGGSILVDAPWDAETTALLVEWANATIGEVTAVVVTHAHDDRVGGLAETMRRGIPSYALESTSRLAARAGWPAIDHPVWSGFSLSSLGVDGELYFPGAGHSEDNAIVWLEELDVLFGGCLVRAASATDLGNTADADLESWPGAIERLRTRYAPVVVVPGHGEPGGVELLLHTEALAERARSARGSAPAPAARSTAAALTAAAG